MSARATITLEEIESRIFWVRGVKVMFDHHLAQLYLVPTKVLSQAVRRNLKRFPEDFMFQLTMEGFDILRSRFVTSKRGGRRYLPYAFTEQGVAMLSTVLHSERAVNVNIEIMRTFVRLRNILAAHKDLSKKIEELEKKYDAQFRVVFEAIRKLMVEEEKPKRGIGFHADCED